jgi:hypothetical protein
MKKQAQNQDPAARIRRQYSAEEKVRLLRLHLVEELLPLLLKKALGPDAALAPPPRRS